MVVFSDLTRERCLKEAMHRKHGQQIVFWLTLRGLCYPQHAKKKEDEEKHLPKHFQILVGTFRFVVYPAWSCVSWVSKNHILLWGRVLSARFRAFEAKRDHYSRSAEDLDKVNSNVHGLNFFRSEFEYASCQLPSVLSWQLLLGIRYHKQNKISIYSFQEGIFAR